MKKEEKDYMVPKSFEKRRKNKKMQEKESRKKKLFEEKKLVWTSHIKFNYILI